MLGRGRSSLVKGEEGGGGTGGWSPYTATSVFAYTHTVFGHRILPPVYLHTHTHSFGTPYTAISMLYAYTHTLWSPYNCQTHKHPLFLDTIYRHQEQYMMHNAHSVYNMQYIPIHTHTHISLCRTQCHHESLLLYTASRVQRHHIDYVT